MTQKQLDARLRSALCFAASRSVISAKEEADILAAWNTRALLSAAPAGDGWQPIETAPRDGTEIILAIPIAGRTIGFRGYWVHIGWWDKADPSFQWRFIDTFDLTPTGCCDMESEDRISVNGIASSGATHWRPLPPPPSDNGEAGE